MSYDIDALDPESAPATGTRVRGGLTFREAHFVAERVSKTGMLSSADLVELNPSLSDERGGNETVDLGLADNYELHGEGDHIESGLKDEGWKADGGLMVEWLCESGAN